MGRMRIRQCRGIRIDGDRVRGNFGGACGLKGSHVRRVVGASEGNATRDSKSRINQNIDFNYIMANISHSERSLSAAVVGMSRRKAEGMSKRSTAGSSMGTSNRFTVGSGMSNLLKEGGEEISKDEGVDGCASPASPTWASHRQRPSGSSKTY